MTTSQQPSYWRGLGSDLSAGLVVFLVALPLCLGIALASNAPLVSGLLAGIIGGILVGYLSGSHTSVSGPAAGLTAVVAAQIVQLGSFEAFLLALMVGGVIQIILGAARAGFIAAFFPSSVIKGLLAAIGVILILKQIPHVVGHDPDPEGEFSFQQPDQENTLSELVRTFGDLEAGATAVGFLSLILLILWEKWATLKKSPFPAPLAVVLLGVALSQVFRSLGAPWSIEASHLVQVPMAATPSELWNFLRFPDFTQWSNPSIYLSGCTIAIVASLETLLNLKAVDKIDPQQRVSPHNRELLAQGVGNVLVGLTGGIPMTSVIVRSSVNINAGAKSKRSAIVHGFLLLVSVVLLPSYLNLIPLSCLAAILLVTGVKLANPALVKQMWQGGRYEFIPFIVTLLAIVFTDLLIGILIGLAVSLTFILNSNLRRPLRRIHERHIGGEVLHIELANQVSFLNRAALEKTLREVPRGGHVLLNASNTDYIDPDILDLIRDFKEQIAPAHGVQLSLRGFRKKYKLVDETLYVDYCSRELQEQLDPAEVLRILMDGNERFRQGHRLAHDLERKLGSAARGQHPLAVVLSCIDSRAPVELIFDLGLGDILSVRVVGHVLSPEVLASMEYSCGVAGARLILILGHTQCGAVSTAIRHHCGEDPLAKIAPCSHLDGIVQEIQKSLPETMPQSLSQLPATERTAFFDQVARHHMLRVVQQVVKNSPTIEGLVATGRVAVVGGIYDVSTGRIDILTEVPDPKSALARAEAPGDLVHEHS